MTIKGRYSPQQSTKVNTNSDSIQSFKMNLQSLPDNLLLDIFRLFPVKERCIAGRVCRRWRRIVNDNSMWRHVDLLPYKLNLKKTWKVIRSHLSDCLLTIKLRGYMDGKGTKWNTLTVSNAILDDLRERCPNIHKIELHNTSIDSLDASKLPNSLTSLTLHQCTWPRGWLKPINLPNLHTLDLTKTTLIDNAEVVDLGRFSTLEVLTLRGCYRVGIAGVKSIAENLTGLLMLDLSDTDCTDLAIHHLSRGLVNLTRLEVVACKHITNDGIDSISEGLKKVVYLDISKCPGVGKDCLQSIFKMKDLRTFKHTLTLSDEEKEKLEIYFQNRPMSERPIF